MSTHDANCPWIYGGACDCGLASDAAERDSLRRDLAVTRAALAQCVTALTRIVETDTHGKNVRDGWGFLRPTGTDFCGRCNRNNYWPHTDDCPIALAAAVVVGVDVAHAVRVEAAREAVIQAVGVYLNARCDDNESLIRLIAARQALDALTSERRRDGGGA